MKIICINGSPKENGNTYTTLKILKDRFLVHDIECEIVHVGNKPLQGCVGCASCRRDNIGRCIFDGDIVNETIEKIREADGIVLGSPVFYSGIAGTMKSFLDRVFYVSGGDSSLFRQKVGASVVALRRSGGTSTFDQLNHYLLYSEMMIATSNYWNVIHGGSPGQVVEDLEGVQIVEVLADNIAWQLKMREATKDMGIAPELVKKKWMNFIR